MANDTYSMPSPIPGMSFVYDKASDDPVGVTTPDGKEVKFGGGGSTTPAAVVGALPLMTPQQKTALRGVRRLSAYMPDNGDLGRALQDAHDDLPATGGRIEVDEGFVNSVTQAVFTKPVRFIGAGPDTCKFRTVDPALSIITTSARIDVDGLGFSYNGTGGAQNGCRALLSTAGFSPRISNSHVVGFDVGIEYTGAHTLWMSNVVFWDQKTYGLKIDNVASPDTGDHELYGLQFANSQFPNAPAALYWRGSGGLKIVGGKWLSHAYSLLCDIRDGANTKILQVTGASMEGMRSGAIRVARPIGGSTGTFNSAIVSGCQFGARGEWGSTPKVLSFGAGVSEVVIGSNVIEGGGSKGNFGVYFEDGYLGGGVVSGNQFLDIHTAVHQPDQGAGVRVGPNEYKGTVKVQQEGCGTQGGKIRGIDEIHTDIAAWSVNNVGVWNWFYKFYLGANQVAEFDVTFAGIQNGAGGAHRHRRFAAWNNGGSIAITDIDAEAKAGTVTTWGEYGGVVGTTDQDGVVIGCKPAANQPLQGELCIAVVGPVGRVRKLARIGLVNSGYSWTASAGGIGEFYLRTDAGANPAIDYPAVVERNLASVGSPNYAQTARGTPGSLAADRWGYGDNDSLGYSTIYVRLPDGSDPDAAIADYIVCHA